MTSTAVTTSVLLDIHKPETMVPMSYAARVLSVMPELHCPSIRVYFVDYVGDNGVSNANAHARRFWLIEADLKQTLPDGAKHYLGTVQVLDRYTYHVWSDC